MEIAVPPGTLVHSADSGELIRDLSDPGERWLFLRGGRGGRGNTHFATATRQTPRFAEPGKKGRTHTLRVELSLIADVGLLGKPNAGKSTLLGRLTSAHPRVGDYPFTTRIPNLGVIRLDDEDILVADVPGIIEGASHGAGLGILFLRHVRRTRLLLFLLDLGEPEPETAFETLLREITAFDAEMAAKPRVVVGNKLDLEDSQDHYQRLQLALPQEQVLAISALTGQGLAELVKVLSRQVVRAR